LGEIQNFRAIHNHGFLLIFFEIIKRKNRSVVMEKKQFLALSVQMFYDLQRIRIQIGGRLNAVNTPQGIDLADEDINYFHNLFSLLQKQENETLQIIKKQLKAERIWIDFLEKTKGVGPTMGAVIISQYDINKAEAVSNMWSFTGLNVVNGKAPRKVKGEKLKYNAWLRTKMLGVLGSSFLKCNSPYRKFYDNYKHRIESKRIKCMRCEGKGVYGGKPCKNCNGEGIGPWGVCDGHRHKAANRYMVKMFLIDLYKMWREFEGLPIRKPYQEEYLGHEHHG
jgi:hypothetical protein